MSNALEIHHFDQAHARCNAYLDRLIAASRQALRQYQRYNAIRGMIRHCHESVEHLACAQLLACALERLADPTPRNDMPNETTSTPESRGQIAYTAYGRAVDFKTVKGDNMPMWVNLPADRQAGWIAAAETIWSLATTGRATL